MLYYFYRKTPPCVCDRIDIGCFFSLLVYFLFHLTAYPVALFRALKVLNYASHDIYLSTLTHFYQIFLTVYLIPFFSICLL